MPNLEIISAMASELDDSFVMDGTSRHAIAVRESSADEIVVEANVAGLVHLASELLKLAERSAIGAHYHLDEAGMADVAERKVVFAFKSAEWD